ncbi:MAG: YqaJ viral recombinase family protein [Syntrophobacteraceae bacterium]
MNFEVLSNTEGLSEDEWLALRKKGIGGSDIAAIAGVSPWKNAITVFLDKIGEAPEKSVGEAAYWGHKHEQVIADEFAERNGCKVVEVKAIIQHPDKAWMIGDIDRAIMDEEMGTGILECKSTGALTPTAACYDEDEGVANEHLCQLQWYMAITGLEWGFIAVLIGGNRYVERYIKRDQETIDHLIKIGSDFWDLVHRREMPAIDGSDESARILDYLYSKTRAESIELTGEVAERMAKQLVQTKADIKAAEAREQEASNTVKALMGEHELAFCPGYQLSWKPVTTNKFRQKDFEQAHPALFKGFTSPTTYRRFSVKEKKRE